MFNHILLIIIILIIILIVFYLINYLLNNNYLNEFNKDIVSSNNSFNFYGKKYILPLLDNSKYTMYVDKLKFKELCSKNNIKTFKTIAILNEPNDIYNIFNSLPNSFVVKSNKGSGRNYIVKNKNETSPEIILKKLENYNLPYNPYKEPQYKYTESKIYIEEYINPIPPDIKIFIYKNKPTILWIVDDRFNKNIKTIYKFKKNKLIHYPECTWGNSSNTRKSELIEYLIENNKINYLLKLINKLKIDLPLARYDFYWYNNDFYGGEITLTSELFESKISENCAKYCVN